MCAEALPAAIRVATGAPLVAVERVSKTYRLYGRPIDRLWRRLGLRARFIEVEALRDVDFALAAGEALGIIGENGAGKSTLLKLIAGTTPASAGVVRIGGRVASILELGAGFHPDFTAWENALLYGALLGIPREEMESKLEEIVAFAELGSFMQHPIRSYSTGMTMRLAFAVATHVDADTLIIDEALSVGDGYFQKKCIDRMLRIKEGGTTVLFCSHSLYQVTMFCDRVLWLRDGRVEADGPAKEVVEAYESYLLLREKRRLDQAAVATAQMPGRVTEVLVADPAPGGPLEVTVGIASSSAAEAYHLGVAVDTLDGRCVLGVTTLWDGCPPLSGRTSYRLRLTVPSLPISRGTFHVSAFLLDESGLHVHDQVAAADPLRIRSSDAWSPSLLQVEHRWDAT